jgi:hypothetical protein
MTAAVDPFPPLSDADADELEQRWEENRKTARRGGRPSARSSTNAGPRNPSRTSSERQTRPTRPKPKAKPSRSTSGRRVAPGRRSTVGARSYRRAAQQLRTPVERELASGMRTIGLTLVVVALYLVLQNVGPFAGALGGFSRALEWLADPTRSVPYAPGTQPG